MSPDNPVYPHENPLEIRNKQVTLPSHTGGGKRHTIGAHGWRALEHKMLGRQRFRVWGLGLRVQQVLYRNLCNRGDSFILILNTPASNPPNIDISLHIHTDVGVHICTFTYVHT